MIQKLKKIGRENFTLKRFYLLYSELQFSNCTWMIDFVQKLHRSCSYNSSNVPQETRREFCDGEERKLLKLKVSFDIKR